MPNKLQFDALRYCTNNKGRMGTWQGKDVAEMIAVEVRKWRERVTRLEEALKTISTLYWHDAPAPEEMREIARRALEEK